MKILVLGSNGQLGSSLVALKSNYPNYSFVFAQRKNISIDNLEALEIYLSNQDYDILINCTSYNFVDKAEEEKELANKVNHLAVKKMAEACKKKNSFFIHVSTDYVFDGNKKAPYLEIDDTHPLNYYGQTKLLGEKAALEETHKTLVIRTSWVISKTGINFVPKTLEWLRTKKEIRVVNDQIGSPTHADELAKAIMMIIQTPKFQKQVNSQLYHFSSENPVSRFEMACYLKSKIKSDCIIQPCLSEEFPTPAQRPFYSYLSKEKIKKDFGIQIQTWQKCLNLFLE